MTRESRTTLGRVALAPRTGDATGPGSMEGYAYTFGMESQDLGGFVEIIEPGAGARSIEQDDILALESHEITRVLGRTSSGTLALTLDSAGLAYSVDLPDTTMGRDLAVSLARRDIVGSSFTFLCPPDGDDWAFNTQDQLVHVMRDFRLYDVGPTSFPAYLDTSASMRSLSRAKGVDIEALKTAAANGSLGDIVRSGSDESRSYHHSIRYIA